MLDGYRVSIIALVVDEVGIVNGERGNLAKFHLGV